MPRTKKTRASDAALPVIPSELIDQIVKGPMSADAVNAASKACERPPAKAGGFGVRLKPGVRRPGADRQSHTILKLSSGSSGT